MHRQHLLNNPPGGLGMGGGVTHSHWGSRIATTNNKSLASPIAPRRKSIDSAGTAITRPKSLSLSPRASDPKPCISPSKPCLTTAAAKKKASRKNKKKVRFDSNKPIQHDYDFDWDYAEDYFFNRVEIKAMNTCRLDEADVLRKERGIRTSSRKDADDIEGDIRDHFIGDALTHAFDEDKDDHEISLRGIEHFVWPVLQKEMQVRKNAVRTAVLEWSIPKNRKKDPKGLKLAEDSAELSKWARDVATERGIKYCEMKRGGVSLKNTRSMWSDSNRGNNTRRNLGSLLRSITNKKVIEHKKRFGRIYGGQHDTAPLTPPRRTLTKGGSRHLTVED